MTVTDPPPSGAAPPPADAERILVIRLGDLGGFVQSLAAARVIRDYHFGGRITLLTTDEFKPFAEKCPYFDVVEAGGRPREPKQIADLIGRIRKTKYDMVYDLQGSARTNNYFLGLKPWPPRWSGVAPGCSHPCLNPARETMHPLDRFADQMYEAGIAPAYPPGEAPSPDLTWIRTALRDPPRLQPEYFSIKGRYVLIVPSAPETAAATPATPATTAAAAAEAGGEPPFWPADRYAALAQAIAARGLVPVVLGAAGEREIANRIARVEPKARNIVSRTDLFQAAALAERCAAAVGPETGLMHLAVAAGAPCVLLCAAGATPITAPRGRSGVLSVLAPAMANLPVADVERAIGNLGAYAGGPQV